MAEDKGKSGGVGGFGAGGAEFGKPDRPGFGGAGKHEGGKAEGGKPGDKIEKMRQRDGFKHEVKRDMFKQGIKPEGGVVEGEAAAHKRHRRRRRRGKFVFQQGDKFGKGGDASVTEKTSGFAGDKETMEHEKVVKQDVKHQKFVKEEKKEVEAVKPIESESLPPELPVAPINPFSSFSSDLPPMSYETRYEDKNKDSKGLPGGRMDNKAEEKSSDEQEPIDTEIPVNPFETPIFSEKLLDEKPLTDRPLEEKKEADDIEESEKSSKKTFDEVKEDFSVKESEPWAAGMPEVSVTEPIVAEVVKEKKAFKAEFQGVGLPEVKAVGDQGAKSEGIEEFRSEFFTVLESAGITKRKIVVFAVFFIAAVIALLFFVFGWYRVFVFWGEEAEDGVGEDVVSENVDEAGGTQNVVSGELSDDSSGNIFGIVSSYIFGLEYQPVVVNIIAEPITTWGSTAGLTASFIFGEIKDLKKRRFSEYAELIRSLKNLNETNIYKLLDLAVDRRKALEDHLKLIEEFISKAENTAVFIQGEMERVKAEYMLLNDQKAVQEEQFFNEVQEMNGDLAYDTMEKFVSSSRQAVALKAYYSANQSILNLVNDYLNLLKPRYDDIRVNSEALIKGIKVFEVPGSNIDAIIPVGE